MKNASTKKGNKRMKNIEIKCDGKRTELYISGVKQEKMVSIVFKHVAGEKPILTISKYVEDLFDDEV